MSGHASGPSDPTAADLVTAIGPVLAEVGLPPAAGSAALTGGSTQVFRLDLVDGSAVVLKAFAADHLAPHRDAYAAGLVAGLGLPTTRYLMVDESRTWLPFPFALSTYLAGEPATAFAAHPQYMDLFAQMGALARRLHAVQLPAYGAFPARGGPAPHASNEAHVHAFADSAFDRFRQYGGDPGLLARLRAIYERDLDAVAPDSGPAVFAHNDLHPGNILAQERDGRLELSGLIDFGNACSSSAVMDLAKATFNSEHMAPGCTAAILAGYGPIDHPRPAEALAFYTLLHRVSMWAWLRQIRVLPTPDAPSDISEALLATADG